MWGYGGKNITTDQTEFTDTGPWSRDSGFNMKHAQFKKKKGVKSLMKYLSKDDLLKRNCRCLISLEFMLMSIFKLREIVMLE